MYFFPCLFLDGGYHAASFVEPAMQVRRDMSGL
jgi:hypothetical protein